MVGVGSPTDDSSASLLRQAVDAPLMRQNAEDP